jgi:hypothetical protein
VSWLAVLGLCGAAYALKAIGLLLGERAARVPSLELVVVPVLAGLVAVQTLGDGRALVLDPRAPALGVAALLVWRRAPLLVVVLASGATAALLRLA